MQNRIKNPNLEFVKTPVIIYGQKYYQVKCIREYKCGFNKRIIKSGELGGYFHELSIDENEPSVWIEQDCIVGAPICETVYAQPLQRERFLHSEIINYRPTIKMMTGTWQLNFGTSEPSMINVVMNKSDNLLLLVDEIYLLEERIDKIGFINNMQIILLWLMLGSILDAFLKIHATIFRETEIIANQCKKDKKNAWNEGSSILINCIEKRNDITREESIILEQINNNRNYIHFLNNETPFDYEHYRYYVYQMLCIITKLFKVQKDYKGIS